MRPSFFFFPSDCSFEDALSRDGTWSLPRAHIWIDIFRKSAWNSCYWLESCTLWLKKYSDLHIFGYCALKRTPPVKSLDTLSHCNSYFQNYLQWILEWWIFFSGNKIVLNNSNHVFYCILFRFFKIAAVYTAHTSSQWTSVT